MCRGMIFDSTNEHTESVDDVLSTITRLSGAKGYNYRAPTNPFETAVAVTTRLRPTLARSLLGWHPRKPSLVDGMEVYFAAYKAFL